MPSPRPTPTSNSPAPRGLVMLWCLWLLGSWFMALSAVGGQAAARWMTFAAMIGLTVCWPSLRLTQETLGPRQLREHDGKPLPQRGVATAVWIDWFWLNVVLQVVLWPLRFYGQWSLAQTLTLAGALAAWSLLTALLIAWGALGGAGRRAVAMAACLLLLLAEPALMALAGVGWTMRLSPIQAIDALTRGPGEFQLNTWPWRVAVVGIAALLGWAAMSRQRN